MSADRFVRCPGCGHERENEPYMHINAGQVRECEECGLLGKLSEPELMDDWYGYTYQIIPCMVPAQRNYYIPWGYGIGNYEVLEITEDTENVYFLTDDGGLTAVPKTEQQLYPDEEGLK